MKIKKEYKLKEVKFLPEYLRRPGKYDNLVQEFVKSGMAIAKVEGKFPRNKNARALVSGLIYAIRRHGLTNKIWVTTRRKEVYLVNIEKTGIRKMRSTEKFRRGKEKERFDKLLIKR